MLSAEGLRTFFGNFLWDGEDVGEESEKDREDDRSQEDDRATMEIVTKSMDAPSFPPKEKFALVEVPRKRKNLVRAYSSLPQEDTEVEP